MLVKESPLRIPRTRSSNCHVSIENNIRSSDQKSNNQRPRTVEPPQKIPTVVNKPRKRKFAEVT